MIDRLKELLWSMLAMGQFMYLVMKGKIEAAQAAKDIAELRKKYAENALEVEKANAGKSDAAIIDEQLRK